MAQNDYFWIIQILMNSHKFRSKRNLEILQAAIDSSRGGLQFKNTANRRETEIS